MSNRLEERHCLGTPLVLYINGNGGFLERMKGTGVDVIGLDWTVDMADGRKHLEMELAYKEMWNMLVYFLLFLL
ncbi:hypothetical protein LOK49_LG05G03291 [Camellia lanceoleosa]|uniref:Uncharacterized protein n=1 Tax=Camellia lanceoleosa TaxID=1840588 RepID=A0ACC0HUA6_9ERIC|nr:hypothetical protein LOK49_LG05G03291 [Camellia lanceoleosa]